MKRQWWADFLNPPPIVAPEPELAVTPADLDAFLGHVQSVVVSMGQDLTDPEADWPPIVVCLTPEQGHIVIGIRPSELGTERGKEKIANGLCEAITKYHVVGMAQIFMAYLAPDKRYPAADHPDAREAVIITEIRGDTGARLHSATVHRSATAPPTLGPWQLESNNDRMGGRFVEEMEPYIMASYALVNTDLS